MTPDELAAKLQAAWPNASINVQSPDNVHFSARIVNEDFVGVSAVQRHQMVYQVLGDAMRSDVHALSLETLAPEEDAQHG